MIIDKSSLGKTAKDICCWEQTCFASNHVISIFSFTVYILPECLIHIVQLLLSGPRKANNDEYGLYKSKIMGILHKKLFTLYQNTEFLLGDRRVLILNETPLSICRSIILRYC